MCSTSSTCMLSGPPPCVQEHQSVSTISSEVVSNSNFFCERSFELDEQSTTPPMSGHSRCCPMTGILPAITRSHDIAEEEPPRIQQPNSPSTSKSCKSNKSSGWKTSKFFSKTMSSGEILRGLKKLSLTGSSTEATAEGEAGRPRKSKSGQLKKRSSCGTDEGGSVDDDVKARSPRSPGGFRPLSKAMSVSEPGSSSKTSNLGIVCRKEDLKAILCTASKKFPLSSPSRRRRGQQAALRQTKSASFDMPEERAPRKEPVRRAGSEETRTRRSNISIDNNERLQTSEDVPEQTRQTSQAVMVDNLNVQNMNLNNASYVADDPQQVLLDPVCAVVEGSISTVKWDECEVVDAVIIGDAIETFLKGSMSGSEKKVSFRKNSDKKAKSEG